MADNQVRVILWCIPRTVSTAFVKSMSCLDDVQIINEPYASAYAIGPERAPLPEVFEKVTEKFIAETSDVKLSYEYDCGWNAEQATYKFLKESILEAEYPGKKVVLVKDMSYCVTCKLDMLPKGYRHAFLIRNPVKVFVSLKKLLNSITEGYGTEMLMERNTNALLPDNYAFGESFQLYEHLVKTGIEPNPAIIDTDDLLENPELMLRRFCDHTGIEYTDKLMKWKAGDDVVQKWKTSDAFVQGNQLFGYYKKAFDSQEFAKPRPVPDRSTLTDDVNVCIDATMPFYEQMYALRLRVGDKDNS